MPFLYSYGENRKTAGSCKPNSCDIIVREILSVPFMTCNFWNVSLLLKNFGERYFHQLKSTNSAPLWLARVMRGAIEVTSYLHQLHQSCTLLSSMFKILSALSDEPSETCCLVDPAHSNRLGLQKLAASAGKDQLQMASNTQGPSCCCWADKVRRATDSALCSVSRLLWVNKVPSVNSWESKPLGGVNVTCGNKL